METHRISVDIESDDHKLLKSYCASIGVTIKEFVLGSVMKELDKELKQKNKQKTGQ